MPLIVNDIHIWAEPDMGTDVNVMDEHPYRSECKVDLHRSQSRLWTLQNELLMKVEFDANVKNQTCGEHINFWSSKAG